MPPPSPTIPYTQYLKLTKYVTQHISQSSSSYLPSRKLVQLCLDQFYPRGGEIEKAAIVEAIRRMVDERILSSVQLQSPRQVVLGLFPGWDKGRVSGMERGGNAAGNGGGSAGGQLRASAVAEETGRAGHQWKTKESVGGTDMESQLKTPESRHASIERGVGGEESRLDGEDPDTTLDAIEVQHDIGLQARKGNFIVRADSPENGENAKNVALDDDDEEYVENEDPEDNPREAMRRHKKAYDEMTRGAAPLPPSPERHLLDTPTRKRKRLEIAASDASSSNEPISPHKYPNSTPRRFAKRLCTPVSESRRRSAPTDYQRSPLKPLDPNKMRALDNLPSVNLKQEKINSAPAWVLAGLRGLRSKYPGDWFDADDKGIKCLDCDKLFKLAQNQTVGNFEAHLKGRSHRITADARLEKQRQTDTFIPSKTIEFEMPSDPTMVFAQRGFSNLVQASKQYFTELEREASASNIWMISTRTRLANLEANQTSHTDQLSQVLELSRRADGKYQAVFDANASLREEQMGHFAQLKNRLSESEEAQQHKNRKAEERFETFEEKQSNRVISLGCKLKEVEEHNQDQLKELTKRIARAERKQKEELEDIRRIIASSEQDKTKQLDHILEQSKKQMDQMTEQNTQQLAQISEKLEHMQTLTETQESTITDLEAQVQVHSEQIQYHQENEEILQQNFSTQMTEHREQTDSRIAAIEHSSEERLELFEKQLLERVRTADKQKSIRIRSLEKENGELKNQMEKFQKVIPLVFEELHELAEAVNAAEEDSEEVESAMEAS